MAMRRCSSHHYNFDTLDVPSLASIYYKAALQASSDQELDRANLIEEVESLGRSERHALYDRLIVLLTHLLKLQVACARLPVVYDRNKRGWQTTCGTQRLRIARLLEENPSLRSIVATETTSTLGL